MIEKKWEFIKATEDRIRKGDLVFNSDDFELYTGIKRQLENSYVYGLGAGLAVSGICLGNYSYLFTLPVVKRAGFLAAGPLLFPLLLRLRNEYVYQNFVIYAGSKYFESE